MSTAEGKDDEDEEDDGEDEEEDAPPAAELLLPVGVVEAAGPAGPSAAAGAVADDAAAPAVAELALADAPARRPLTRRPVPATASTGTTARGDTTPLPVLAVAPAAATRRSMPMDASVSRTRLWCGMYPRWISARCSCMQSTADSGVSAAAAGTGGADPAAGDDADAASRRAAGSSPSSSPRRALDDAAAAPPRCRCNCRGRFCGRVIAPETPPLAPVAADVATVDALARTRPMRRICTS